jgi:S-adenosylmethionine:tRNA ribosyltransferase-isomerase
MRTSLLDYHLPEELIATRPAEPRDSARMMVVRRSADTVEHRIVRDLPDSLQRGDALVFNNTAVLPARFLAVREDTGGRIEGLFIEVVDKGWLVMLRSNGRLRAGMRARLLDRNGTLTPATCTLIEQREVEWIIRPEPDDAPGVILEQIGLTPLPPYIRRARRAETIADALDRRWYQTTYARDSARQSVAAPTAGLHFTPELLSRIDNTGIARLELTLHVGPGTFKPVTTPTLEEHRMHEERFSIPAQVLRHLREVRPQGGRAIAVGTTSVRALESVDPHEVAAAKQAEILHRSTKLMIHPPFEFRWIDGLLTNFHLPRSTLLALVAALVGLDRLHDLYRLAIAERYRFYSYGDCMLILP